MSNKQKETTAERKLLLSEKEKTYEGHDNEYLNRREVPVSELKTLFTTRNFSGIIFREGAKRLSENFEFATGMLVDHDDGSLKVDDAVAILRELNLNYALVTSRKHNSQNHRFHIFIPFTRPVHFGSE